MTTEATDRLPLDALPASVRQYVEAVSTATQTPVELAAFAVLGTAAGACLGGAEVAVPWGTSPLAFYATVALPSGERKSAVLTRVTAPLRAVEAERREAARPEIAAAEARREVLEGERRRAIQGGDLEAAATAAAELAVLPPVVIPRFLVDDVTPERLGTLLADHGQTAVIAAESAFFDNIVGGRYSDRGGNLHLVCQAYMGEATSIDRQGAETRHLPEPLLVLMLCVQPHVLANLVGDSKARAQGLVARMMLAQPPSMVGSRNPDPDPVPFGQTTWWDLTVRALTRMRAGDRLTIEMGAEAGAAFRDLRETHEGRLGTFGDLGGIVDWANRHPDRVARLAALLCLLDGHRVIGAEHMAGAIRIGEYLIREATRALDVPAVQVPATKREVVVARLTDLLRDGPVTGAEVRRAADDDWGVSWRTIESVTAADGEVPVTKTGGPGSVWSAANPATPQPRNGPARAARVCRPARAPGPPGPKSRPSRVGRVLSVCRGQRMSPAARTVVDALREALTDPDAREEVAALLGGAAPRTLHTTATIARELEVSERTVRRAIEAGELAATRRTGRWVMTAADVEAWVRGGASPRTTLRPSPTRAARRGSLADIFAAADS